MINFAAAAAVAAVSDKNIERAHLDCSTCLRQSAEHETHNTHSHTNLPAHAHIHTGTKIIMLSDKISSRNDQKSGSIMQKKRICNIGMLEWKYCP